MSGVVQGGWEFVVAAYAVSGCVFVAYFVALHLRYRAERRTAEGATRGSRSSHE